MNGAPTKQRQGQGTKSMPRSEDLESLTQGDVIAMKIHKYHDELPQIGRILRLDATTVTIQWMVGSYTGNFSYWKEKGSIIAETFPRRGIMCRVLLTQSMRLGKEVATAIKEAYKTAEFV
jgi:hypothetical protein